MKVVVAVGEVLSGMRQLNFVAEGNLLNYSALARQVKPLVEKKVGRSVEFGAVLMACKRFFTKKPASSSGKLKELLASCRVLLKTDLTEVHAHYSNESFSKLFECMKRISWSDGEKVLSFPRASGFSILVGSKHLNDVLSCFKSKDIIEIGKSRALITLYYDQNYFTGTYGCLWFWLSQFDALGINVLQVFSSWGQTSFLVREDDAPAAFSNLVPKLKER